MKGTKNLLGIALIVLLSSYALAFASSFAYKVKMEHDGGDVTPAEAHEMMQKDSQHIFLIDVRTRAEYQLIGHPNNAHNIPIQFWTGEFNEKKYSKTANQSFGKDLLARFNPKTDTLLFICRSGKRSCIACNEAVIAGWPAAKVYNVLGGFEGDKEKDEMSPNVGKRLVNGWKNEKLPWTYAMNKDLLYQKDIKKDS